MKKKKIFEKIKSEKKFYCDFCSQSFNTYQVKKDI